MSARLRLLLLAALLLTGWRAAAQAPEVGPSEDQDRRHVATSA